jgi:hypothetical protein
MMGKTTHSAYINMALPGQTAAPDLLGVWNSPLIDQPISSDEEEIVIWRADLPRQTNRARQLLEVNDRLIRGASVALPWAEQRLMEFANQQLKPRGRAYRLVEDDLPAAEAHLQYRLWQTEDVVRAAQSHGEAFASPREELKKIKDIAADALHFFESMRLALAHFAWAETAIDGQVVGRTEIGWLGDFQTVLHPRLSQQQATEHRRLVSQALASKQAMVRISLLVTAGAFSLASTSLTGPLGLLAVFRFVQEIIAEVQQSKN